MLVSTFHSLPHRYLVVAAMQPTSGLKINGTPFVMSKVASRR